MINRLVVMSYNHDREMVGNTYRLLGKLLKETNICSLETMQKAIEKVVPPKKAALIPNNFKAIELGMNA